MTGEDFWLFKKNVILYKCVGIFYNIFTKLFLPAHREAAAPTRLFPPDGRTACIRAIQKSTVTK